MDRVDNEAEVLLAGGFSNVVVKSGDTVRRPAAPWTTTVHALLNHLRAVGFTRVPEPLGFDQQGREVLSWIEGQVALWPWPEVLMRDDGLLKVTRMVRAMQQAVSSFEEPATAEWQYGPRTDPEHVIRHGDLGPWNTLWVGDELTGLIDWDGAGPAPSGWDVAQGAWYFVPLRPLTGYRAEGGESLGMEQIVHRYHLWCAELEWESDQLLPVIDDVQRCERDRIVERGRAGIEPYATFLAKGDDAEIEQDRAWLAARERILREPPSAATGGPAT